MKYRIVEVQETNGTVTWRVQERAFLFLWINVEHYVTTSEFGSMDRSDVFYTLESAQAEIQRLRNHRKNNSRKRTEKVVATYDDIH